MVLLAAVLYFVVLAGLIVTLGATEFFGVKDRDGEHGLITLAAFLWPLALPCALLAFVFYTAVSALFGLGERIRKKIQAEK